jgi:putative nucleotidyltransferase with HDIG domain
VETLRLSDVIAALSHALDITEGQPEGHAVRSCRVGMRLAETLGLSGAERSALFYALLLKDLGCSSNAAKMCWLFRADDRVVKRDVKLVNWRDRWANLTFGISHALPGGRWLDRLAAIAGLARAPKNTPQELIKTRCERGADIVRMLGFPEATAQAILGLDEHWDGGGHPLGLAGDEIPLLGRLCCLAQTVEVFVTNHGVEEAYRVARHRRGTWFDPALVDALARLRNDKQLWGNWRREVAPQALRELEPDDFQRQVTPELLDQIAVAFSQVVDAKSPWTFRHSEGVAELAVGMAERLGWSDEERRVLRRTGLLHDLGKVGVSNLILDKPGRLTDEEFVQMRQHVVYTHQILSHVPCFRALADDAAAHHERLDGRGYYRGLAGDQVSPTARLLAVADVCEALSAKRPYRDSVPAEAFLSLEKETGALARVQQRVGNLEPLMAAVRGD